MRSALLLSMTGFGEARFQDPRWSIEVEVRTVNNRHLKLSARISEPYSALEPELERLVREKVRRGAVQMSSGSNGRGGPRISGSTRWPWPATATSSGPCRPS